MNKTTLLLSLLAFGLSLQTSFGQLSFAGYTWYDSESLSSIVDGNLVSNMGGSSSTWTVYLAHENTPITLNAPGDKLVITWKFRLTNVNVSNTSQNFRIGILDSPAETRVTGENSPASGNYTGYAMFGNMGQVTDNSGAFQIRERNEANNPGSHLSSSSLWTAQDSGMGKAVLGYEDGTEFTFVASIERTANGSAQVDYSMTGGSINGTGSVSVSFLDGTPQPFVYDTFIVRPSNASTTADTFTTTAFTVEAPEGNYWPTTGPGYLGSYDLITGENDSLWVDTGDWLGLLYVDLYPQVWVAEHDAWIYFPDPDKTGTGPLPYIFVYRQ